LKKLTLLTAGGDSIREILFLKYDKRNVPLSFKRGKLVNRCLSLLFSCLISKDPEKRVKSLASLRRGKEAGTLKEVIKAEKRLKDLDIIPFDWENTWYVWLVYSASCCLFEFLLFRDKKKKDKELTGGG